MNIIKKNKKNDKKEAPNGERQSIFNNYKLPNYLDKLLNYIEKKQNITYVTVVVHIKKNAFSFSIYSDVTYKNGDGTVDIDMNALQSSLLIDAIPDSVVKLVEKDSEYSVGFSYEDLQKLFRNRTIIVEEASSLQDIVLNKPEFVKKIVVKDEFFYTVIEYYDNQNVVRSCKHIEYLTGISEENSPYPLDEIEISDF